MNLSSYPLLSRPIPLPLPVVCSRTFDRVWILAFRRTFRYCRQILSSVPPLSSQFWKRPFWQPTRQRTWNQLTAQHSIHPYLFDVLLQIPYSRFAAIAFDQSQQSVIRDFNLIVANATVFRRLWYQILTRNRYLLFSHIACSSMKRSMHCDLLCKTFHSPDISINSIRSLNGAGIVSSTLAVQMNSTLDRSTGTSK